MPGGWSSEPAKGNFNDNTPPPTDDEVLASASGTNRTEVEEKLIFFLVKRFYSLLEGKLNMAKPRCFALMHFLARRMLKEGH